MSESGGKRQAQYRFQFGTAQFDESRFELRVGGEPVEVQRKPLEILRLLLAQAGEVVTKEELLETVWEGRPTVENVIANAIAKLRAALGADNADRIVTLPRIGYRFDGSLERVAVGRVLVSPLALAPGTAVPGRPAYQLEALVGRSAASEVWLARHARTRDPRVYKFCSDGSRLSSLKREATLSRLLHENLGERQDFARVLDWNFESPPFFLECEYGGRDLLQWAADGHLAALSTAQRVQLFLQIADAAAAAHGIGVLHKDLKPANVLVAPEGDGWRVRLTDFGSSHLLEPGRLAGLGVTRLGFTMSGDPQEPGGTALYLAPELISGSPPTVAGDVYALGVMLYQLVVGDLDRPLAPGWERGVPDELLAEDIARATDGDPAQRLQAVAELTTRLRSLATRHSARRREQAAAQEARIAHEALQRSRARRPWIAAAVVLMALGTGVSLWLYRDARVANERSEAINGFLNWAVLANTGALKTDSDPDPSMRRVLRNAADSVGDVFAKDPSSEGWIRLAIGQGLSGLGDHALAEEQQRKSVELLRQAHGSNHERTQVASYALAMTLLEQSRFSEAEVVLGEIDGVTDRALRGSENAFKSHALRGMLRATRKDCAGALEDFQAAEAIELPDTPEMTFNRFNVRSWIGESLNCVGRYRDSEQLYVSLLGDESTEAVIGPTLVAYAQLGYAKSLQQRGQPEHAGRQIEQALRRLESEAGDADAFSLGQALVEAGGFYMETGHLDLATEHLTRGRALLMEVGEQQERALAALRGLGVIDYARGLWLEAADKLEAAREGLLAVFGEESPEVQGANFWLAATLLARGESEPASRLLADLQPEALQASLGGAQWPERLQALQGRLLIERGELERGRVLIDSATTRLRDGTTPAWLLAALLAESGDALAP